MDVNIFFHGSKKVILNEILNKGLKTRYGRATFTQNPKYALNYSGKNPIKDGVLLVFQNKYIKRAKDSEIVLNKKEKVITGWPNRWRTEQFGYYTKNKKEEVILDSKYLLGIFYYNAEFLSLLETISKGIIKGKINKKRIKEYEKKIKEILSNKDLQAMKPRISLEKLSKSMIYGMIRNLILREIRANHISFLVLNGWKIRNPSQLSCKKWLKKREQINIQMFAFSKMIKNK